MKKFLFSIFLLFSSLSSFAQINTDRVILIGRNSLYYEDYVLAIQYFNQVIKAKPYLAEPYFYRAIAKYYLDDFKGTEDDCTLALERNPFISKAYQLRADARQNQNNYDGALEDYKVSLDNYPNDKFTLVNMGIVNIQKKDYDQAEKYLNELLRIYPTYTQGYLTRGAMYQEKGDTIQAFENYNEAIKQDKYMAQSYSMRGLLHYYKKDYDKALADLDEAIKIEPLQSGNYINRGLIRYSKNDLRGAMADYDKVIELDANNIIARFNRGLLRAQVGDDNRAIADFDVVLKFEPNNYIAYFNRSLIKSNIGDYNGAIADLNVVLAQYPEFYHGFYSRGEIKRRQNDLKGAERDFNYARNEEARKNKEMAAKGITEEEAKTRETSDKDIDKFNLLVVADKKDEEKSKYESNSRGRIQNKQVRLELEPRFVITYYEKPNDIRRFVYYSQLVDGLNRKGTLPKKLRITNSEAALNEPQIADHFWSINELSKRIEESPANAELYYARALDYMLVQDFGNSIENFNKAIALDPRFTLAYFDLAVVYTKQLELKENVPEYDKKSEQPDALSSLTGANAKKDATLTGAGASMLDPGKMEYDLIVKNYSKVIELNPEFVYAYYNRAEIRYKQNDFRAAILDYNEAIRRDPQFAEAYYNRGLARFQIKDKDRALDDMRKAGELGVIEAYSIIKRMTE